MKTFFILITLLSAPTWAQAADSTAPGIYNIQASSTTETSSVITWTTNEYATRQVLYGTSTSLGSRTPIYTTLRLTHSVSLSNLQPGTTYYYRVRSKDRFGNQRTSAIKTFITNAVTPPPTPVPDSGDIPLSSTYWHTVYNGYGYVSYDTALAPGATAASPSVVFAPMASTQPDETHAVLITAKKYMSSPIKDFKVTVVLVTEKQLRTPTPNAWECFWLFFNYSDNGPADKHTNYLVIKPNGTELGRAYDDIGQDYLKTSSTPSVPIGVIHTITVEKRGGKLWAYLNGNLILSYDSATGKYPLFDDPGTIGLYSEDSRVRVYSVKVEPL